MKWADLVRRWTMRTIHSAVFGAALLGSADAVFAQAGATASQARHYAKSQTFDLPVQMDQADRLMISEFRLYMRTPTSGWKLQDTGPQHLTRFTCRVPADGEYWYILATVDRAGRMEPADVTTAAPNQRVIVDTTHPVIAVSTAANAANELCLRCTVTDSHADHATLQAMCRTNGGDVPLERLPNQPGTFRLKGGELLKCPVIVSVRDMAGNVATKEINVREMIGATVSHSSPGGLTPASAPPDLKGATLPPPRTDVPPRGSDLLPAKLESPSKITELPAPGNPPMPIVPPPGGFKGNPAKGAKLPQAGFHVAQSNSGAQQLINTTRAKIEYRLDDVGLSGVGRVEIHMTPDRGQTWHRLAEDTDKKSPAEINLPGDGVYGIRIVVTNGNGYGGKAPVRGDAPHCTIEVDSTKPFVLLRSTEVLANSGHVELRWNATDNNLGAAPVSLFYRTRVDGPWQDIARNLKNEGLYRWAFPREAGGQFFFKIEVADRAGNVSEDVSRQPVVIDISEPRVTVVGVVPGRP